MAKEAHANLELEYEEAGVFDEMFEINEEGCRFRPWFTTASGILADHVHEMLLQGDCENIWLLPACEYEDVSFKLAANGGAVVTVDIEGGELKFLQIDAEEGKTFNVYYKGEKVL